MSIEDRTRLRCPHCKTVHAVRGDHAGRTVRCAACRGLFRVPERLADAPAAPAAGPEEGGSPGAQGETTAALGAGPTIPERLARTPQDSQVHLRAAAHFLAQGRAVAARQECRRALALGAPGEAASIQLGTTYLVERRPEEAIEVLGPVHRRGGHRAAPYLAAALAVAGRHQEAEQMVRGLGPLSSSEPSFWQAIAIFLASTERYEKAAEACRKALELAPRFAPALYLLGFASRQAGERQECEACYRTLLEMDPDDAEALWGLAVALYERNARAEAWEVLREAARRGIRSPGLRNVRAWLLLEGGRYRAAHRVFSRLLAHPQFHAGAVEQMAHCLHRMGDVAGLRRFYESLSAEDRDLPVVNRVMAHTHHQMGRPGLALPFYRRYAEQCPQDVGTRVDYALALLRAGRLEESVELAETLQRGFPDRGEVDYLRGAIAYQRQDLQAALACYSRAASRLPQNADAQYMKGELMVRLAGHATPEVIELWRRAIRLNPRHELAWYNLAWDAIYHRRRRAARALITRAIRSGCRAESFEALVRQCR